MIIDNNIKLGVLLVLALGVSHALDPMYNYRYNLAPEILVPDAFHYGIGAWTFRNEDLSGVANIQLGLTDRFEIGMKFIGSYGDDKWIYTKNRYREINTIIDVGAKFAVSPHVSFQVDVPMSINKDMEWSGILSLTTYEAFARNVSFIYEGRIGFGEVVGEDSYLKPALGGSFYFQIMEAFRVSFGAVTSCSFGKYGDFKDDVMLDILPRVEAGFTGFRLMGEVAIGIFTLEAQKHYRFAMFIMQDL